MEKKNCERKNLFNDIYKNQIWNNKNNNIPLSGFGSSLIVTQPFLIFLDKFIKENNIISLCDIGCGDLTWISHGDFFNNDLITYNGIDISEYIINLNKSKYQNKNFFIMDVVKEFNFKTELIILRDVIFHLENEEILKIFENIKNKFKYICITSCVNLINTNIFDKWHFSKKNILIEPFNISKNYLYKIDESDFDRSIFVYNHDIFYKQH